MAMVSVVNRQPTGGLMVQADWLGPKVGGHLAPCCTHRVNHGELSQCFKHDDCTINLVEVLLLYELLSCVKLCRICIILLCFRTSYVFLISSCAITDRHLVTEVKFMIACCLNSALHKITILLYTTIL